MKIFCRPTKSRLVCVGLSPKYGQTANVKPLAAKCRLLLEVRLPNLDLQVSNVMLCLSNVMLNHFVGEGREAGSVELDG